MINKNYHIVGTITKSIHKSDVLNTCIYDWSISWIGTGTSIKSGGVKLVL
jgi:hypothetical protein